MRTNYINDGPPPEDNAYSHHRTEDDNIYRARAARAMLAALEDEGFLMTEKTKNKVMKALNTELRNAMDEVREAYAESQATIGKTP